MYKACIFDMDGTLVNTLESIAYFGNRALESIGASPLATEGYRHYVGNGADVLMDRMLEAAGVEKNQKVKKILRTKYDSLYEENPVYLVEPYEGIPEMLAKLNGMGIKLAVLSNKPDNMTKYIAEKFFPGTFEVVNGQRSAMPKKPDPAAVYKIMDKLGVRGDEVLYVGDSDVDMLTGKNAGVATIGVLWGFRDENELRSVGAMAYVKTASELEEYILGGVF